MRITREPITRPQSPRQRQRRRNLILAAMIATGFAWTALVFAGGIAFLDYIRPSLLNLTGLTSSAQALRSVGMAPRNFVRSVLAGERPERIVVDVKFRDLMSLEAKRQEAMDLGILMASGADLVPAEIRHRDDTVRVKIRLKGDYTDHLAGDKWSLRVETRGNDQLFGMRRFSLQAPRTRGFQAESVVLSHLRREGVLAPRYFFVETILNGKDIGLMAVEEHFSKELLEHQRRREGVILRFDETPFFENRLRTGIHGPFDNPFIATIRPFRRGKVASSPQLSAQLDAATGLLRAFMAGDLSAADVFDVDLLGRFLAVAEIWRTEHLLAWHNLRLYFNPITQRIEPVGYDANLQSAHVGPGLVTLSVPFSRTLLEDADVREAFILHLRRIAEEASSGALGRWVREVEAPALAVLHREFPFRAPLELEGVAARARWLAEIDATSFAHYESWSGGPFAPYAEPVRMYLTGPPDQPELELVNALPVRVEVSELRLTNADGRDGATLNNGQSIMLPSTPLGGRPDPVHLPLTRTAETFGIAGSARVTGQARVYPISASSYVSARTQLSLPRTTSEEALARHDFIRFDSDSNRFEIPPGLHRVRSTLVLPAQAALRISAGATLQFERDAALITSGALDLRGSAEAPVVLEPSPEAGTWPGVVVLSSPEPYRWEHAVVRGTRGIEMGSWVLTGGVTLRQSDVRLAHVQFVGNRTEDALNLVRSQFEMENVEILDTPSDAFDGDFSDGVIKGGRMSLVGGDGIDVSGARVRVIGTELSEIRDKAVSAGEGSVVHAEGLRIDRVGTAFASKDRSELTVEDSELTDVTHVGLMAYVKKPEYGPASVQASGVRFTRVGREALAQTGSRVELDGRSVPEEDVDIESLYAGGYMRK